VLDWIRIQDLGITSTILYYLSLRTSLSSQKSRTHEAVYVMQKKKNIR